MLIAKSFLMFIILSAVSLVDGIECERPENHHKSRMRVKRGFPLNVA